MINQSVSGRRAGNACIKLCEFEEQGYEPFPIDMANKGAIYLL